MTGAEILLSAALLAAAEAEEAGRAPDPARDQRLVDACNARAAEAVLDRASVLLCAEAYERLLDHHGGYRAYRAARERRRAQ